MRNQKGISLFTRRQFFSESFSQHLGFDCMGKFFIPSLSSRRRIILCIEREYREKIPFVIFQFLMFCRSFVDVARNVGKWISFVWHANYFRHDKGAFWLDCLHKNTVRGLELFIRSTILSGFWFRNWDWFSAVLITCEQLVWFNLEMLLKECFELTSSRALKTRLKIILSWKEEDGRTWDEVIYFWKWLLCLRQSGSADGISWNI